MSVFLIPPPTHTHIHNGVKSEERQTILLTLFKEKVILDIDILGDLQILRVNVNTSAINDLATWS